MLGKELVKGDQKMICKHCGYKKQLLQNTVQDAERDYQTMAKGNGLSSALWQ